MTLLKIQEYVFSVFESFKLIILIIDTGAANVRVRILYSFPKPGMEKSWYPIPECHQSIPIWTCHS